MMIEFACLCGHRMRLTEKYAGMRVRCSRCQSYLQVPLAQIPSQAVDNVAVSAPTSFEVVGDAPLAAPRQFEVIEDKPAAAPRREKEIDKEAERRAELRHWRRVQFGTVRYGFFFQAAGVALLYLKLASMIIGIKTIVASHSVEAGMGMIVAGAVVGFVAEVLAIGGTILCLIVPRAVGARSVLVVALVLYAADLLIGGVQILLPGNALVSWGGSFLNIVLEMGAWVSFLVFLDRLAIYIRVPYLEIDTAYVMRLGILTWSGQFVLAFISMLLTGIVLLVVAALIGLAFAVLFFKFQRSYLNLLFSFRNEL
jgi:hypothetical protein